MNYYKESGGLYIDLRKICMIEPTIKRGEDKYINNELCATRTWHINIIFDGGYVKRVNPGDLDVDEFYKAYKEYLSSKQYNEKKENELQNKKDSSIKQRS